MRFIICLFIIVVVYQLGGNQAYEPGKITDPIPVSNTANETIALYLPTSFGASVPSSIIFILNLPDGDVKEI